MTKIHVGYEIVSTFSLALSFGAAKERAFTSRRVYKKDIVNSVTTEILYLHDGMNAIVERNKTGTPTEYIYGPTGIIAIKTPSSMFYVIKDHLGSTRVMINTTEQPYALTTYDYSAFGTILTTPTSSAYLYTGQEWDRTSGLHNFKARMYDSDLAMFYGADPAGAFASPFSYVNNSPIIQNDPSGELPFLAVVAIYTAVHVGADAVRGDIDSWRDLGVSAGEGALQGTFAALTGGTSEAVTASQVAVSAATSELPSANLRSGPINVSISPSFALSTTEGFSAGFDISAGTSVGPLNVGTNLGVTRTSGAKVPGLNGLNVKSGVFGGVGYGKFSFGVSSTRFEGSDADFSQTLNSINFRYKQWSAVWSNDWNPISPANGTDKGRTASVEIGYGAARLGFNVYTSAPGEIKFRGQGDYTDTTWGENPRGSYTGKPYASALYLGYVNGRNIYRAGLNSPYVQDFFCLS
jgi:RHS repeat-associated protein